MNFDIKWKYICFYILGNMKSNVQCKFEVGNNSIVNCEKLWCVKF